MIASFMMYRRPENDAAIARLWRTIRSALAESGIDSPAELAQSVPEQSLWTDAGLLLSQSCGMPYRLWLHPRVTLVGTPDYGVEGCARGYYRSLLIVHRDDERHALAEFRHARFAYNQQHSQSGFAAPWQRLQAEGFWFDKLLETGAHREAARAVAERRADIASIDAVSWRLLTRFDDFTHELRVLTATAPTPGLPVITAFGDLKDDIHRAMARAIEHLDDRDRDLLGGLRGFVDLTPEDYFAVDGPRLPCPF